MSAAAEVAANPAQPPQDAASPPASETNGQGEQQNQQQGQSSNPNTSRRVTIGGSTHNNSATANEPHPLNRFQGPAQQTMSGGPMDNRRGSMSSAAGFMDDSFFRRGSLGLDMAGMDNFFGRRDSMDSSTAVLDAAIMDLSRRRYSAAAGMNDPAMFSSPTANHESISQRQQQLQQQQRELEQRQKELEYQRQQLIASMQERSYTSHRGSLGGSLGLGSVGSRETYQQPHRPSNGSTGSGSSQWWICQVCSSKAFASREEGMAHEAICRGTPSSEKNVMVPQQSQGPIPPLQQSLQPGDMMGRPSMTLGYGMDGSGRNLSMGMGMGGMMDNSSHRGVVSMGMDSSRGMMDSSRGMGMDSSRNMSLGMDSSQSYMTDSRPVMSMGPFAMLPHPMPLAMPSDKDWLTPLHCFVRGNCVEVFTATEADVATPSKGKRKPIQVGQIGIRCPHCHALDADGNSKARERGSVYYPTTISSIYNATMNLLQRHLHNCPAVPDEIMRRYETLKADDARSGTSKKYWIESALSLGLVDTPNGIRHSALRPPPLPSLTSQQESEGQTRRGSNEFFSTKSNVDGNNKEDTTSALTNGRATGTQPLVTVDDKPYATTFSYELLTQMQPCVFTEADRLGKRKGLPPGFPGLACRHCFGGYGSGRFFPSSIKTLSDTSKTLNVLHNHMMRCRKCPAEVKENLDNLRGTHDEERAKMKFGSQKAFFARIWERLHGKDSPGAFKRQPSPAKQRQQQQKRQMMHQQPMHYSGMPPHMMHQHPPVSGLDALAAATSPHKRHKANV